MPHFFEWTFGIQNSPDLEKLKAVLHSDEGESTLIQTASGVCIRSERSIADLEKVIRKSGFESPISLKPVTTKCSPDIQAFIQDSE